jgi:hypothetical protein
MNTNYVKVVAGFVLFIAGINFAIAQSGPEFLNCPSSPISLCVNDPGVRLPANNQIYSSEADTNATSCSVHITQSIKVKSNCGHQLQFGVQLFLDDTSIPITVHPLSTIMTDALNEAELVFNSELSSQSFIQKNGIPYNSGCNPYHRIKWIVIDSCGSINECEELINVYDCYIPQLNIPPGTLYILELPVDCKLYLHANDFRSPLKDDCTPEASFKFSLKEEEHLENSLVRDPCDIPAFGVELPFDFWIADGGRDINCNGNIEWSERNKYKHTGSGRIHGYWRRRLLRSWR